MVPHKLNRPSLTAQVFVSLAGEFHPCLVSRRGRVAWQGPALPSHAAALAAAETERTARYIRLFLRSELRSGAVA